MDRENRAKQFMPFDALKGFREALAEKERLPVEKRELSEEQKAELSSRLRLLHKGDPVTTEYFQNGEYVKETGVVSKIDEAGRVLILEGHKIPFDDLSDLRREVSAVPERV